MSRPKMDRDCAARLRSARCRIYRSARAAARDHGWPEQTYRSHENGLRGFDLPTAKVYGSALGVRWEWLLAGEGEMEIGRSAEGMAMMAKPDPAAFAEELSDAVWGPASAGFTYADRAQAGTEEPDNRADIVIPAQHEIEVYENSSGAVVLKMDAGGIYDEDQVVIIRPEHVDAVVAAMLRIKGEALA